MTDRELAQKTRQKLEERGWQPAAGMNETEPLCLFQAIGVALCDTNLDFLERWDRSNQFAQTLGFKDRDEGVEWNDGQENVEAIYERLDKVT